VIGDGQRIAVTLIAQPELAFVIGAPQGIGAQARGKRRAFCVSPRALRPGHQPVAIQDGVNGAAGRPPYLLRQPPQEAFTDLARALHVLPMSPEHILLPMSRVGHRSR